MNRKTAVCVLLWAAVLGMMAAIFAFSAQPGEESEQLTRVTAMPIAELIASIQEGADEQTAEYLFTIIGGVMRKIAHFAEYALLGLLLRLLCMHHGRLNKWLPVLIGVLYAASDEIHQTLVPGRKGMAIDVLLDSAGILCGVYAEKLISNRRRK